MENKQSYVIYKTNLQQKTIDNETSNQKLIEAVHISNLKEVKELLENQCDASCNDNWPIKLASEKGYTEIVNLLMKHGADIRTSNDYCLCWAATNGHQKIVEICLEHNASIHIKNDYPLRHAARNGQLEMVKYLLEKGCNINLIKNCENKKVSSWINMTILNNTLNDNKEKTQRIKL